MQTLAKLIGFQDFESALQSCHFDFYLNLEVIKIVEGLRQFHNTSSQHKVKHVKRRENTYDPAAFLGKQSGESLRR